MPHGLMTNYSLLVGAGVVLSAVTWWRLLRRGRTGEPYLWAVYLAGLAGALAGAKLAFFFAEGWAYRDQWQALLTGKSITGALLGGYGAVELVKWGLGMRRATGDLFAFAVPIGVSLGRVGCLLQGCCLGILCEPAWWTMRGPDGLTRWPAAAVELGFNGLFLFWAVIASVRGWQVNQRFHIYLIAYGLFRFGHEFARDTIRLAGPLSGYQIVALALVGLGSVRYLQRRRSMPPPAWGPASDRS